MNKVMGMLLVLGVVSSVAVAEEPAINPIKVATGRLVIYGTTAPLKIGSTEFTETSLLNGVTTNAANLSGNIAAARLTNACPGGVVVASGVCTQGQVVAFTATTLKCITMQPTNACTPWPYPSTITASSFKCDGMGPSATSNYFYCVTAIP